MIWSTGFDSKRALILIVWHRVTSRFYWSLPVHGCLFVLVTAPDPCTLAECKNIEEQFPTIIQSLASQLVHLLTLILLFFVFCSGLAWVISCVLSNFKRKFSVICIFTRQMQSLLWQRMPDSGGLSLRLPAWALPLDPTGRPLSPDPYVWNGKKSSLNKIIKVWQ